MCLTHARSVVGDWKRVLCEVQTDSEHREHNQAGSQALQLHIKTQIGPVQSDPQICDW